MTTAIDWTGPVGDVWAREWRRTDRSFGALSPHLDAAIHAAAPPGHFGALDIGCGAGATSLALAAARPDAEIIGIDLSPGLIDVARERVASARFLTGDVVALAREHAPFDVLYSRHGVMFFADPVAAFAALHATAARGARLVFSCFRSMAENAWAAALVEAAGGTVAAPAGPPPPGPFAFADPARVAAILTAAGWREATPTAVDFAYRAGEGADPVADALEFFTRIGPAAPLLRAADADGRPRMMARIEALLAERRVGDAIDFPAAAWIWSANA